MNSHRRTPTPPPLLRGGGRKVNSVEISNTPPTTQRKKDVNGGGDYGRISPLTPINKEAPRRTPSPMTIQRLPSPNRSNASKSTSRTLPIATNSPARRSPSSSPARPRSARQSPVRSELLKSTTPTTKVDAATAIARARSMIHSINKHQKAASPALKEEYHRYCVAYNRLLQWRFANARREASMAATHRIAQKKLVKAWVKVSAIRNSTSEKRLEVQKMKQDLKLYEIMKSEMKLVEEWSRIEKKNVVGVDRVVRKLSAIAVCLPVDDDVKVDTERVDDAMWEAMEVVEKIQDMVLHIHSQADKIWW